MEETIEMSTTAVRITAELKKQVKVRCAQKGITMEQFFEEAVKEHLKRK